MANTSRIVSQKDGFYKQETTLDALQVSSKSIVLDRLPADPEQVIVLPVSGTPQKDTTDFIVVGNVLSWDGKGLETILELGDTLIIAYPI